MLLPMSMVPIKSEVFLLKLLKIFPARELSLPNSMLRRLAEKKAISDPENRAENIRVIKRYTNRGSIWG